MKKLTFRNMLDNLRSSVAGVADAVTGANKFDVEPDENVKAQEFAFAEVSRSGFPQDPCCLALEPVQRILAIGTRQGSIRLLGRPGVDYYLRPGGSAGLATESSDREALLGSSSNGGNSHSNAVLQIIFLVNEGTFVAVHANNWLHLWSFKGSKRPDIIQSLEFQKETLTVCHIPYRSKWLFAGTDKGNVHVVQIDAFVLSGYIINWNKAMELSSRSHPGRVIHLSDCPSDAGKLLIGFDSGLITLWDLKNKGADVRFQITDTSLCSISWHHDGKQFVSSHADGTLAVWNPKVPHKATSHTAPHARRSKDDAGIAIVQVEWKKQKGGNEALLLFSGGVAFSQENSSIAGGSAKNSSAKTTKARPQTMSIVQGKSTTVLEMEHPIVAFLCVPSAPHLTEGCEHEAVIVLLENDLVAIDLAAPGYPLFENPYSMDLHEPPAFSCYYVADCPSDIIPTLYTAGAKHKKSTFTDKEWPIDGGMWGSAATPYSDLLLTCHSEGTIRFWDVSSASLQHLDRLKINRIFERSKKSAGKSPLPAVTAAPADAVATQDLTSSTVAATSEQPSETPPAVTDGPIEIQLISLDPECRCLAVGCVGGLVILYMWNRQEISSEIAVLDLTPAVSLVPVPAAEGVTALSEESERGGRRLQPRVKSGLHKRAAGYQPVLVCYTDIKSASTSWSPNEKLHEQQASTQSQDSGTQDNGALPSASLVTSLAISSKHGLLAIGSDTGLIVVDIIQKHCVMNLATPDLYGSEDPFQRGTRSSPKHEKAPPHSPPVQTATADGVSAVPAAVAGTVSSSPRPSVNAEKAELVRSRSSSSSSLDFIASEAVLCLKFADTYGRRADVNIGPCLWVGTELGSVLVLAFQLPSSSFSASVASSFDPSQPQATHRLSQPVIGVPTGTLFRYNNSGAVVCIALLDAHGALLNDTASTASSSANASTVPVQPASLQSHDVSNGRSGARPSEASAGSGIPALTSLLADARHILVLCMERQIRTFVLPSQALYQKYKLHSDPSNSLGHLTILKATVENVKENACIFCYLSSGRVTIYSLPSLRPLLDVPLSPANDLRLCRTLSFGRHAGALFMASKSELQKLTFSAETASCFNQPNGELFIASREQQWVTESTRPSAVAPAVGFLKSLMGAATQAANTLSASQQVEKDREELFGEAAGKGSKALARHVAGSAMEQAKISSNMANSEIGRAKMLALERGEKLGELDEATERMRQQAEAFAGNAHQLASKYKDKKWYQL
ncbi:hypothetical protein RvY_06426 [Ramazzottius varieornatus]|uniref:V-SNARE coiled-coil homology domain-containing protein n=1 Tax=Ramazzottius varieornatus TaxID=947166 RepID=A0A1D1UZ14_RAMVA|nr:hypothetical protein RvY_06426 [Ramazzottius varieornatus]